MDIANVLDPRAMADADVRDLDWLYRQETPVGAARQLVWLNTKTKVCRTGISWVPDGQ